MAERPETNSVAPTNAAVTPNATLPPASWDSYLGEQLKSHARISSFDMNDEPDQAYINQVPLLKYATEYLNARILPPYRTADKAASSDQRIHRILARVAIVTGGSSIVLAVIQLALKTTAPTATDSVWAEVIKASEALAVLFGVIAVSVGLYAKFEHKWLTERHKAERLRMLKFRALGRADFWSGDTQRWEAWVDEEIAEISKIEDVEEIREWTSKGRAEPELIVPPTRTAEPVDADIATYYRRKRVEFQSNYFLRQSERLGRHSPMLNKPGVWLFLGSVVAVLVHFGADYIELQRHDKHEPLWEQIAIWALACAVVLPIVSLCIRAWIGAFEFARSAHLFRAKHNALKLSSENMKSETAFTDTMRHVANVEYFMEHEHREWLRLVMSAEWFV